MHIKRYDEANRYLIPFGILFVWVTIAYAITHFINQEGSRYALLIDKSAKQQMLSQRVALLAHQSAHMISARAKADLAASINEMYEDHQYLYQNLLSSELETLFEGNEGLHTKVESYLKELRIFLRDPKDGALLDEIILRSQLLLPELEYAVSLYVQESAASGELADKAMLFIYLVTLLILVGTAFFIIHPMALRLQNYTEHLEEEVECRVSDLAVFSAIFENSSEGMILTDEEEKITRVNRAFMKIAGYQPKDVLGLTPRVLKSTRQTKEFYEKMWESIEQSGIWSGEIINKNAKGEEYHEYLTILKLVSQKSGKVNYVGIFSDLSQIHYNMRRLQDLIDLQSNIILVTDGSKMLFANRSLVRFFGYETLEQFLEQHRCISELFLQKENYFHPSKAPAGSNWVSYIATLPKQERVVSMVDHLSRQKVFNIVINHYDDNTNIVVLSDISDTVIESDRLREKAQHDALTGCYNREYLYDSFDAIIEKSKEQKIALGLILMDIDHFKKINDTHGHNIGDAVLREMSALVRRNIRDSDFVVRWGGEEFIIVVKVHSLEDLLMIAHKFRQKVELNRFSSIGHLTCSFGVAIHHEKETLERVVGRADEALYKAKEGGRNRVDVSV